MSTMHQLARTDSIYTVVPLSDAKLDFKQNPPYQSSSPEMPSYSCVVKISYQVLVCEAVVGFKESKEEKNVVCLNSVGLVHYSKIHTSIRNLQLIWTCIRKLGRYATCVLWNLTDSLLSNFCSLQQLFSAIFYTHSLYLQQHPVLDKKSHDVLKDNCHKETEWLH